MAPLLRILLSSLLLASSMAVEVIDLPYRDGDLALHGRLALPDGAGPHPAVLVVHEWWGRNDYAERRARELAELGYVALAADGYGAEASLDFPTAVERSNPFYADPTLFVRRFGAGLAALRARPEVDVRRVAAVGFCFGGAAVLQLARSGSDLRGVVSLHGGLKTARHATPGAIQARILVCHGGADPFVPPADVAAFTKEMLEAGADWQFRSYPGAVHAFSNPAAGDGVGNVPAEVPFAQAVAYQEEAEQRSIAAMQEFLAEVLAP